MMEIEENLNSNQSPPEEIPDKHALDETVHST